MYDCAKEVLEYHKKKVTLLEDERAEMRKRRDANRARVTVGLEKNGDPAPRDFVKQGSYAMRTMIQHPNNDYDIDDGIYFDKDDLKGSSGAYKSSLEARKMVCNALQDERFAKSPEVRTNCVRIYYDVGYHVDMPVYRKVVEKDAFGNERAPFYELASANWKRSDARDVTKWFEDQMAAQGGDGSSGRQMRRVVREIKKYARSRESWSARIASGFCITKLVTDCFRGDTTREDRALYDTMKAVRDRLNQNLEVDHPVTPGETITKGGGDARSKFLRDRLTEAMDTLAILFNSDCSREQALKAWDKTFNTTFFIERLDNCAAAVAGAPLIVKSGVLKDWGSEQGPREAVRKVGGGRFG